MSNDFDSLEKEFDDQVYEDEYYEENYDEEELEEDEDDLKDDSDDDDEVEEKHIHVSYACEDCDYRWDAVIVKVKNGNLEDEGDDDYSEAVCPMCGSMNVEQI